MEDMEEGLEMFGPAEYFVVAMMLLLSLLIGVYFTFWSRQDSYSEYMLGGRKMGVFPVTMSLVASNISGIALVGNPPEVYSYGTLYSVVMLSDIVVPIVNITMFLPVFFNLQLNTLYEYLELRFNHGTRVLGSLIFTFSQIVYMPAIIYVPSLVFNQVSGVSVLLAAFLICAVCIFYTTFGGLKAVLWTDALQNLFSLAAIIFIAYLGVDTLGGLGNIFAINKEGGRIEFFNMEPSPFVRNSFWTLTIGNLGNWMAYLAINAGSTQRYLAMPSLPKAKRAMWWSGLGITFVHGSTVLMGMILYARYHGCDPFATGEIKKTGQMLPLYVTEVTSNYPGLAGLFVSGILSAALSSMSSSINTMAGTLYEDIVEFIYRGKKQSEAKQSFIMKVITLLLGLLCVFLVLLVEKADSIFQIGMSLAGITNGALMTLFVMGLFIPRANATGAIAGALSSLVVMTWLVAKTQYFFATGKLKYPGKHTSVDLCPFNYTGDPEVTSRLETYRGYSTPVVADPSVGLIYQLSYMHYTLLGTLIGVVVGVLVSLATAPPPISARDRHLFSPVVQRFLPRARPKSNSVRFAEEEFKLVDVAGEVVTNVEKNDVPPKEDIQKPE